MVLLALVDLIFKPPIVASLKALSGGAGSPFSAGARLYLTLVGGLLAVAGGVLLRLTRPSLPS